MCFAFQFDNFFRNCLANRKEKTPTVSVIILNYQTPDLILGLLKKIGAGDGLEIIIVDNSPDQELKDSLNKNKFNVRYYYPGKNLGFSGGNNYGIAKSKGEWLFFLNSDTECTANDIFTLVRLANKHNLAAAAPKLFGNDGRTQWTVGYFDSLVKNPANFLFCRPQYVDPDKISQPVIVDVANASALMIKKEVFKTIGMWDENHFFMYFEDIDLCRRLWQRHIPILYCPQVKILHSGGGTSNKDVLQKNVYYQKSLKNYLLKHRGYIIETINDFIPFFS